MNKELALERLNKSQFQLLSYIEVTISNLYDNHFKNQILYVILLREPIEKLLTFYQYIYNKTPKARFQN